MERASDRLRMRMLSQHAVFGFLLSIRERRWPKAGGEVRPRRPRISN
jgi:hypothetical protein